jgi:hypothetical protein
MISRHDMARVAEEAGLKIEAVYRCYVQGNNKHHGRVAIAAQRLGIETPAQAEALREGDSAEFRRMTGGCYRASRAELRHAVAHRGRELFNGRGFVGPALSTVEIHGRASSELLSEIGKIHRATSKQRRL